MKEKLEKILKLASSRLAFLVLGVMLSAASIVMAATWSGVRTTENADPTKLEQGNWNNLIGYLEAMDGKIDNIVTGSAGGPGGWDCQFITASNGGSGSITANCEIQIGAGYVVINGSCPQAPSGGYLIAKDKYFCSYGSGNGTANAICCK